MAKILTKRKQAWVNNFKPKQLKGLPLNPNAAAEIRYYNELRELILKMTAGTQKAIDRFFKGPHSQDYFGADASVASQARILMNALMDRFDELFGDKAKPLADDMVDDADKWSATQLKTSLKQLSGGLTLNTDILTGDLNEILSASVTENVGLIKSIPAQYLDQVQGAVMRSITTGNGLADLVPFLKNQEGVTLRRARIIAQDQTRKAFSNINFARFDKLGIKEYEWLHSAGGQKPRRLHINLSGKVFSIDKPPVIDEKTGQRGKPGDLINCRCRAIPVVKFETD